MPGLTADALAVLRRMPVADAGQRALRDRFVAHLDAHPDGVLRTCRPDHLTASTTVLSADGTQVLLTLHAKARRWFQLGGHAEPGDRTLLGAARREAAEESGLDPELDLAFDPVPVHLDEHAVPFCGSDGQAHHLDVRFVAVAPDDARHAVSDESLDVRWWPVDDLPNPDLAGPVALAVARAGARRESDIASGARCGPVARANYAGPVIPAAGSSDVRVRFAPSPTGMFHVGGARSALFNWAVAKQQGGIFVLRVEDTDAARNKPEWVDGILNALAALGMHAEDPTFEGPYFQSQNVAKHREASARLFEAGKAYYCDCTRDDVAARTGNAQSGYDGFCRDRGLAYEPGRALRFRTPDEGETQVVDLIRGNPTFPNSAMEDFVVARGDGSPVFLLANVVDDMDEGITHVIRGEEHLPNTPKQQLLWEALGAQAPTWAHLPVIVNEKRQKLSKRRDKVALEDYLAEGYLPEAMVNYLMLLGWAPGNDEEILPFDELIERFRIEDVNSASAFFDVKKLASFNGEYIRKMSVEDFITAVDPWLHAPKAPWTDEQYDAAAFGRVAPLAQSRVALLADITDNVDFLFLDAPVDDERSWSKAMKPGAAELLSDVRAALATLEPWEAEPLKDTVAAVGEQHGLKLGKAQAPVRVAVTGRTIGLPLFESLEVLGRERTLARVDAALARLAAEPAAAEGTQA